MKSEGLAPMTGLRTYSATARLGPQACGGFGPVAEPAGAGGVELDRLAEGNLALT